MPDFFFSCRSQIVWVVTVFLILGLVEQSWNLFFFNKTIARSRSFCISYFLYLKEIYCWNRKKLWQVFEIQASEYWLVTFFFLVWLALILIKADAMSFKVLVEALVSFIKTLPISYKDCFSFCVSWTNNDYIPCMNSVFCQLRNIEYIQKNDHVYLNSFFFSLLVLRSLLSF